MSRPRLFVEFEEKPPAVVRTELHNLAWSYNPPARRWEYLGPLPPDEAVHELERRLAEEAQSLTAVGGDWWVD